MKRTERCGDCHHFYRCSALICTLTEDDACDFSPSRFVKRIDSKVTIAPMPRVVPARSPGSDSDRRSR